MVQDLVLVVAFGMAVVLGYSLGLAHLKDLVQEKPSGTAQQAQLYQVLAKKLESQLAQEKAQVLVLQSELESALVRLSDSELELVRVKAQVQKAELAAEELRYRSQETDWKDCR
jgi:hypothetical protein